MPTFKNMGAVEQILSNIQIPRFIRVRQIFQTVKVEDIGQKIREEIRDHQLAAAIQPDMKVVIGVGSRQINNLAEIVKEIVFFVKAQGGQPFIIPAMGSHGGATAEGQAEILNSFGINEDTMGAPILADMSVTYIGDSAEGDPVYVSDYLLSADAVILINRVKPHPAFTGEIESGITKMSVIGLGKQKGADYCHRRGLQGFSKRLQTMSKVVFEKIPVIFGVAILENPYDETAEIHCIPAQCVAEREPLLLVKAREYMPRLIPEGLDVLIVDEIGKNISGTGADPNVMGRFTSPYKKATKSPPARIIMRRMTEETHGAAAGIGQADFITKRLYEDIDYGKIYVNSLTSTLLQNSFTPLVMKNDSMAIKAAIKTCGCSNGEYARIVRIKNTLEIESILVSEAMASEIRDHKDLEILSDPFELRFDEGGEIIDDQQSTL